MTAQEIKSLAEKKVEPRTGTKASIEAAREKKKQRKVLNAVGYVAGSITLFTVACATLPSILSNVSGALYKASLKREHRDDDDWGPVIERKEKADEPEQADETAAKKEDDRDGD